MKTQEEFNALKEEATDKKPADPSLEELEQVVGGSRPVYEYQVLCKACGYVLTRNRDGHRLNMEYLCPACQYRGTGRFVKVEISC